MKKFFYTTLLSVVLILLCISGYSQNNVTGEPVSVSLAIVGKGTPDFPKKAGSFYYGLARITNVQDTAIRFFIMSCSWPGDNWITNTKNVYFWYPGCDSNFPESIVLSPNQSLEFNVMIACNSCKDSSINIKAGFLYYPGFEDLFNFGEKAPKPTVYWSNEVAIKDNRNEYSLSKPSDFINY